MEEYEETRTRRRDLTFTVFQIGELIFCFCLYCYYSAIFSALHLKEITNEVHAFVFRGYILSIYILGCNIAARFLSNPKHQISPLEVFIMLCLWLMYVFLAVLIMHHVKMNVWKVDENEIGTVVNVARKLGIATLIASTIFLLDALFRIDVLIVKYPDFKSPHSSFTKHSSGDIDPAKKTSTVSHRSEIILNYTPLSIDYYWLRCPDCLLEETPHVRVSLVREGIKSDDGAVSAVIHKDLLYPDASGSGHNLMSKYATARRKRQTSRHDQTYLSPSLSPDLSNSWINLEPVATISNEGSIDSKDLKERNEKKDDVPSTVSSERENPSLLRVDVNESLPYPSTSTKPHLNHLTVPVPVVPSRNPSVQTTPEDRAACEMEARKILSFIIDLADSGIEPTNNFKK